MQASILCPNCKKATLNVNLFGSHAEYAAQCPVCGPVFGFVILGFRDVGLEPTDKLPGQSAVALAERCPLTGAVHLAMCTMISVTIAGLNR
jgi:hypothetical protein